MARFSDVDVFLAVVEAQSFRGAAARLSVTRSTVSRAVARLEAHLGTPLLLRDTRSVRLTAAGVSYHRGARRAAAALCEAERAAQSVAGDVRGTIRLPAPPAFGPGFVAAMCASFLARHPDVSIDLVLTDRLVNPLVEDIDLAVRVGARLADSDLKSRRLADLELVAVATPEVAAAIADAPAVPAVLFTRPDGSLERLSPPRPLRPRLRVNDHLALRDAVLRGVGVGVTDLFLVADDLAAGHLERVLPGWKLPAGKIWVVYPSRGALPARLRLMLEHLAEGFAALSGP